MRWSTWRKIPDDPPDEPDGSYATAGPNPDCAPGAPPPNNPNHPQEEREGPEPSETTSVRRWVSALRAVRQSLALLSVIWALLPHESREFLLHLVQR
jgi:hypothetical protein